ncbi:MAG: alpha/beta hydrolase [Bacilli bacterium]|nr:alpha/beta hydrolase [Bacilli bacterium]
MNIIVNNLNINYEIYGVQNNKTIILLHGWGTNLNSFKIMADYLNENYKVIAIDLPGFGSSSIPDKVLNITEYSKIIYDLLIKLNVETAVLIGHSFGGRIAITLAGHYNYNAEKIVLINSAGIKPKRTIWYYIKVYTYKFLKKITFLMPKKIATLYIKKLRDIFGSKDYNEAPEIMKGILSLVVNEDLRKYMKKIKAPTLLLWGQKDSTTPISDAVKMKKTIPDSGLIALEGAGHYSYLDKHYEIKKIILYFLKSNKLSK